MNLSYHENSPMMKHESEQKTRRDYKSRLFEMIFSDKKELLELYNAVSHKNYKDPDLLEVNTLENVIYLSMHNDISFVIDSRVFLYEHQSTYSPNLPLRFLMYMADLYSKITKDKNLYGSKMVKIPAPRFLIFYNGPDELVKNESGMVDMRDRKIIQLSDMYQTQDAEPALNLFAEFININPGRNPDLLNACKTLRDYSEYTYRVRQYTKECPIGEAVEKAIEECISEGILAEFLTTWKSEAIKVSIYEYDEERQREFDREEGRISGKTEALLSILDEIGEVPEDLSRMIANETNLDMIDEWIKQAIRADSIEAFVAALESTKE